MVDADPQLNDDGAAAQSSPAGRERRVPPRLALGLAAILGPLALAGAVAASVEPESLPGPTEAVASAVGIGGNSGEVRNDYDARSEAAGDVGQPGSCPGMACDAPGHSGLDGTEDEAPPEEDAGDEGAPGAAEVTEDVDPHANGKGCDDVLFAGGDPPFGGHETPVGPCNEDDEDAEAEEDTPEEQAEANDTPGNGADPHANGHGCDDVLFGAGEPPFGGHDTPVGPCNREDGAPEEETTPPTEDGAEVGDTAGAGRGNSAGKGNGKNK